MNMVKTHKCFNKYLGQMDDDDKIKSYYSKMVDLYGEAYYGGWNYPKRMKAIVDGEKVYSTPWVKRAQAATYDNPTDRILVNADGGYFLAPTAKLVLTPLKEIEEDDIEEVKIAIHIEAIEDC
jgi:hypothetical protein